MATLQLLLLSRRWPGLSAGSRLLAAAEAAVLAVLAMLVPWSRVYLGYHTAPQVFAGSALGAAFGSGAYRLLTNQRIVKSFDRICAWPVLRALHVRNTWFHADIAACEHRWSCSQPSDGGHVKAT